MSYSSDDPTTRLTAVRAAIDRCLTSQEYQTAAGQKQVAARLADLFKMEESLRDQVGIQSTPTVLGEYER